MMKRMMVAGVALLALAACNSGANNSTVAASGPVTAVAPPSGTQWTMVVSETPEGGMRMGNPNAAIKIVEYGSLTCPACSAFSAQATEPLKTKYVATGKVSWEYRSLLLHAPDLMASLAYKCGGPGPFFALMDASYADMPNWLDKLVTLPPAEAQRLQSLPLAAQNTEYARISGRDEFVAQRGISRESLAQCLADPKKIEKLDQVRKDAFEKYNVQGTPTFFINDKVVPNVSSWDLLEPELRAAGA
jgi:protein-disulfide isomerase